VSDLRFIALVTATPGTIAALASLLSLYHVGKQKQTMELLEKNTNSMKDDLVALTGKESFARGVLHEKENSTLEKKSPFPGS